jgi:ADP-heptose:LPS heptosyltransferase
MHECRFFLGACSGMAHLAGLLQKPGVVVTLFGHDGFKFFYNRIFPSIECHSRKELLPKLA